MLANLQASLQTLAARLAAATPKHQINHTLQTLLLQQQHLKAALTNTLQALRIRLGNAAATLDALSPLATMQRGFAVATKAQHVLTKASEVQAGDKIAVRLLEGKLECVVESVLASG